jgi:hypothetical protein
MSAAMMLVLSREPGQGSSSLTARPHRRAVDFGLSQVRVSSAGIRKTFAEFESSPTYFGSGMFEFEDLRARFIDESLKYAMSLERKCPTRANTTIKRVTTISSDIARTNRKFGEPSSRNKAGM